MSWKLGEAMRDGIGPRVPPDRELGEHDLLPAPSTIRSHAELPFEEGWVFLPLSELPRFL